MKKNNLNDLKKDNRNIKTRVQDMLKYIAFECKDIRTIIIFIIVVAVVYSPVWVGYIVFYITKSYIALSIATIVLAFWAGPFTPFFPTCIAITLYIKTKYYSTKEDIRKLRKILGEKRKIRKVKKLNKKILRKEKRLNNEKRK